MVEHKFLIHYSAVTYICFSNYLACLCMTLDLTILLTAVYLHDHYLPNIFAILVCHVADGVEPALSQYNFNISSKMTMARAFSPEEMELRDALKRHATNNPGNPGKNVSLSITMKGNNYMYIYIKKRFLGSKFPFIIV